jgi:hypothetical protein
MKRNMILNLAITSLSLIFFFVFGIRCLNDIGLRSSPKFNFLFWEWSKDNDKSKEQIKALNIELKAVYVQGEIVIGLMLMLDRKHIDKISDLTLIYKMPTNSEMPKDETTVGLEMTLFNQKGFIYTNESFFYTLSADKDIEIRMEHNLNSIMNGVFTDEDKFRNSYIKRRNNEGILVATWRDVYDVRQTKKWKYSKYLELIESYKKNGGFLLTGNSFGNNKTLPPMADD